ncbi:F-box only protein 44-like [Glandiceps talaboti]
MGNIAGRESNYTASEETAVDHTMDVYEYDQTLVPDNVLTVILSCVPDKDLLNCMLVCKRWYMTIQQPTFWKIKCLNAGRLLRELVNIPSAEWRNVYFKNPYGRNLIRNPCGDDGVSKDWIILMNGGNQLRVEDSDIGCKPKPIEMLEETDTSSTKNFASSYGWCHRVQVIDLIKEGCSEYVMDEIRPDIDISEWYAARWDCGSIWEMRVSLSKKTYNSVQDIKSSVSSRHGGQDVFDPTDWGIAKGDIIVDTFIFGPQTTPQWSAAEWHKVKHTFTGYGPGVRSIIFEDASKDTQFWAGHYGGKMSAAVVKIKMSK